MTNTNNPLHVISDNTLSKRNITLHLFRLDLLHPDITGNKWYKLKYNLDAATKAGHDTLLSFGGAWSNHIHALAWAGKTHGFNTIGIIRGEPAHGLTPTLKDATSWGMQLKFVSRSDYRNKHEDSFQADLISEFGDVYILPEGGSNDLAVRGCAEIVTELNAFLKGTLPAAQRNVPFSGDVPFKNFGFDVLVTPVGTGGTLAGLVKGIGESSLADSPMPAALGISVLKGAEFQSDVVQDLLDQAGVTQSATWRIDHRFHAGGYAKRNSALLGFIDEFLDHTGIQLEPVYSGKMMWGLFQMIEAGEFAPGCRIVALHTGGLQGFR
jgi:1-aminocyclopropane-1-carboxylate deaminase